MKTSSVVLSGLTIAKLSDVGAIAGMQPIFPTRRVSIYEPIIQNIAVNPIGCVSDLSVQYWIRQGLLAFSKVAFVQ